MQEESGSSQPQRYVKRRATKRITIKKNIISKLKWESEGGAGTRGGGRTVSMSRAAFTSSAWTTATVPEREVSSSMLRVRETGREKEALELPRGEESKSKEASRCASNCKGTQITKDVKLTIKRKARVDWRDIDRKSELSNEKDPNAQRNFAKTN